MPDFDMLPPRLEPKKLSAVVVLSYVFDWLILIIVGLIGYFLGNVTPNKRPFSLLDGDISFPVTQHETVTTGLLLTFSAGVPIVIILVVALVFVPGRTVPKGTPTSLIWKRRLWELHIGWLGLALSLIAAWIITNGMKNLFGKPRPDLLSRCMPDVANVMKHVVGFTNAALTKDVRASYSGQLVSANICTNPDKAFLDDGFRSYPSGHSSSSAAGLLYLSLFLASKFAITIPFVPQETISRDLSAVTAFPSRLNRNGTAATALSGNTAYEGVRLRSSPPVDDDATSPLDPVAIKQVGVHNSAVAAIRRQAAAPPVYLLLIAILPFFLAVFIASSRWFDFRHHGFDILFGFFIGTVTAFFSFRYYHMPIRAGGGWAWGPRSRDKAFWAGLGSWSYASGNQHWLRNDEEENVRLGMPGQDIELEGIRQGGAPPGVESADVRIHHHDRNSSSRTMTLDAQTSEFT
ncbi:acid phosphatase/Vanadium-dependent haloperoxidase [Xylaria sp. CBS 124048]|nr:acid phosphatase/Vanadium-dependent haloperoxidase [Xylaria sp. CBS 124048]